MVWTSARPPGARVMRSRRTSSMRARSRPLSSADARVERLFEIEFAVHRPRRDGADLGLEPERIGQFVDAFLLDHGRIHVGDEELLAAMRGRHQRDVDGLAGKQARGPRRPDRLTSARRSRRQWGWASQLSSPPTSRVTASARAGVRSGSAGLAMRQRKCIGVQGRWGGRQF